MTARCEPPEHLRGVDGWHWVQHESVDTPTMATWEMPEWWPETGGAWRIGSHLYMPAPAHKKGWRYLSPVAPPAVVRGLVEALEGLLVGCEYRPGGYSFAFGDDVPAGWGTKTIPTDAALDAARSALAAAKEAGP